MTVATGRTSGLSVLYAQEFTTLAGFRQHFNTEPPWKRDEILQGHLQYFGEVDHLARPFKYKPGRLVLEAKPTPDDRLLQSLLQPYTSGCLNTLGKFSFHRGTLSVRAGMSGGKGLRSLIRLLPVDDDLNPRRVPQIVLADGTSLSTWCGVSYPLLDGSVYAANGKQVFTMTMGMLSAFEVTIDDDEITWHYDGREVFKLPMPRELQHLDWHVDVSLIVGNELAKWGSVSERTAFPARLYLDHIRHFVTDVPREEFNTAKAETLPPTLHRRVKLPASVMPSIQAAKEEMELERTMAMDPRDRPKPLKETARVMPRPDSDAGEIVIEDETLDRTMVLDPADRPSDPEELDATTVLHLSDLKPTPLERDPAAANLLLQEILAPPQFNQTAVSTIEFAMPEIDIRQRLTVARRWSEALLRKAGKFINDKCSM